MPREDFFDERGPRRDRLRILLLGILIVWPSHRGLHAFALAERPAIYQRRPEIERFADLQHRTLVEVARVFAIDNQGARSGCARPLVV